MYVARDLPAGKYAFVAVDYSQRGLALVKPAGTRPIDWATGTIEITGTDLTEIWPFAHPFVGPFKDADRTNQGTNVKKQIKVVEKGATTAPSSSQTAAPTTTITSAVAKAGNKAGLASTGASPLGFLALGAVLLAAGASAFFVARRRRS
ncbi:LPXTG cell wall anchor domain-containing protein [Lentzea sp. PSKA42]|uniref:LPXTG cell wall anchor domain-containing protein n=2 Tax=Lentzea indica TaxID=2604800 RepID=A0ABX1F9P6_9PSEU|nr:LPXTG cell wall anchor domain-containing protein [Lentzea indica]